MSAAFSSGWMTSTPAGRRRVRRVDVVPRCGVESESQRGQRAGLARRADRRRARRRRGDRGHRDDEAGQHGRTTGRATAFRYHSRCTGGFRGHLSHCYPHLLYLSGSVTKLNCHGYYRTGDESSPALRFCCDEMIVFEPLQERGVWAGSRLRRAVCPGQPASMAMPREDRAGRPGACRVCGGERRLAVARLPFLAQFGHGGQQDPSCK